MSTRAGRLVLPDLQEQCCTGLHVCFPGLASKDARAAAAEHGCSHGNGRYVVAFSGYSRSQVDYTVSLVISPLQEGSTEDHFVLDIRTGRKLPPVWLTETTSAGELVEPCRLKQADFHALAATCISQSGARFSHASAVFVFPWSSYRTFMELPMKSPDQTLTVRGIRLADAEDSSYVVLDVPGPQSDSINVSCSLHFERELAVDDRVYVHALDRLVDHIGGMVMPREG